MEKKFESSEILCTITDIKGNILHANSAFCRIAEYEFDELLQKPHNIIRHPDMPKVIFKLLWEYMQNGKPIVAYVKNRTKNDNHYWVLATVLPVKDFKGKTLNHISLRVLPTTDYLKIVQGLYSELLDIEEQSSIEESEKYLMDSIRSLGFSDYIDFMNKVIESEIEDKNFKVDLTLHTENRFLLKIAEQVKVLEYENSNSLKLVHNIEKSISGLEDSIKKYSHFFASMIDSSINSNLTAIKLKERGQTFKEIVGFIRIFSNNSNKNLEKFTKEIIYLKDLILKDEIVVVNTYIRKLLILIMVQDIHEYIRTHNNNFKSLEMLRYIGVRFMDISKLKTILTDTKKVLKRVDNIAKNIKPLVNMGKIESAHSNNRIFMIIMNDLKDISDRVDELIEQNFDTIDSVEIDIGSLKSSYESFAKKSMNSSLIMMAYEHEKFAKRVEEALEQKEKIDVTTYKMCNFGKYYYGDLKQLADRFGDGNLKFYYEQIESYHKAVHNVAKEIVDSFDEKLLKDLHSAKDSVIDILINNMEFK